jgi:hypothetical protein
VVGAKNHQNYRETMEKYGTIWEHVRKSREHMEDMEVELRKWTWLIFMIAQFVALVQEKNSFGLICWSLGSFFGYFAPTIWDCSQPDIPTMGGNI